ncbi:DUF2515 domain-containing protein [Bacillus alveayuensis]|uniref:DUF2515 domain-containing protein n=1 Tax=Aeribacillus alveayuensis TaxID=279215 RepID=UPI000ABD2429|nr:DUF2515 domain-containing protein [Bacillus alveayuensis]
MGFFTKMFSSFVHPFETLTKLFIKKTEMAIATHDNLICISNQLEKALIADSPQKDVIGAEKELVSLIKKQTEESNLNNITRTKAYFSFFQRCPEVHWAFLAHTVSRNGGWNMTDLKGDIIGKIMAKKQIEPLFLFLERANAFIFQDAYPQLLLYEESKRKGKNVFHLLPHFSVSSFMRPFWEHFLLTKNSSLLTVALIINEQKHIQKHVIEQPFFQEHVIESLSFLLQQWLGFNDVIIPFYDKTKVRLAGTTIHDFSDVDHRIAIGKTLYGILFYHKKLYDRTYEFALNTPHTGSRADFWPHLFFHTSKMKKAASIYSPKLVNAWPNIKHRYPQQDDWFADLSVMNHLYTIPIVKNYDITNDYLTNIVELSSLALSKQILF